MCYISFKVQSPAPRWYLLFFFLFLGGGDVPHPWLQTTQVSKHTPWVIQEISFIFNTGGEKEEDQSNQCWHPHNLLSTHTDTHLKTQLWFWLPAQKVGFKKLLRGQKEEQESLARCEERQSGTQEYIFYLLSQDVCVCRSTCHHFLMFCSMFCMPTFLLSFIIVYPNVSSLPAPSVVLSITGIAAFLL